MSNVLHFKYKSAVSDQASLSGLESSARLLLVGVDVGLAEIARAKKIYTELGSFLDGLTKSIETALDSVEAGIAAIGGSAFPEPIVAEIKRVRRELDLCRCGD